MKNAYSRFWVDVFPEKYFEGAAAAMLNHYRNHRQVKLSDIAINKRNFEYWKNKGLFEDLKMQIHTGGWRQFNGVDEVALLVVGKLWDFGFDIELIKTVLQFFYSNSFIKRDLELYLENNKTVEIQDLFHSEQPDLLSFFVQEKKDSEHLIINLEFLMLLIQRTQTHVSLIFDANKNLNLLIGDDFINLSGSKSIHEFFSGTFLSVSITELYANIYIQTKEPDTDNIPNIIKNAWQRPDKNYEIMDFPPDVNISSVIKKFDNQNITIEVRNKRKFKVSSIIISSKNI